MEEWFKIKDRKLSEKDGDVLVKIIHNMATDMNVIIGRMNGTVLNATIWSESQKMYIPIVFDDLNNVEYSLINKPTEYQKIQTLYERDERGHIIEGKWTYPEFKQLKDFKWDATEKIDGTNIRVIYHPHSKKIEFAGRTDNAQIPPKLLEYLENTFTEDKLSLQFGGHDTEKVVLYGEGYGEGIRNPTGKRYRTDVSFILFDVNIDGWWMSRNVCKKFADGLEIDMVPYLGKMTIVETVDKVRKGFLSNISEDKTLLAEGIVLRTPDNILRRNGERIVCKIKHKDFK